MAIDVLEQVAITNGRIIHAGTGKPVVGNLRVLPEGAGFISKVSADGSFVVSGNRERLFPELETQDYVVDLTVSVQSPQFKEGPQEIRRSVRIPANYPFDFPIDVGVIEFIPEPVIIRGAVYDARPGQNVFMLQGAMHFGHAAGTVVQQVTLQVSTEESLRALGAEASAGSTTINLRNGERSTLAIGQILQVGSGQKGEYGVIERLPDDQPNVVVLRNGLVFSHSVGQLVQRVEAAAVEPANEWVLVNSIGVGDRFILLDLSPTSSPTSTSSTRRLKSGYTIMIEGGSLEEEYQTIYPLRLMPLVEATVEVESGAVTYRSVTDSLGHFQISHQEVIDGGTRDVGERLLSGAKIRCEKEGFVTQSRKLVVDFSQFVHEEYFYLVPPMT
jgi:hypothetical protein